MYFDTIIYYFVHVYPGFLVELILAEALFAFKLSRKKFFAVRLVAGLLSLAALTFLVSCIQPLMPSVPLLGALPYLVFFAFTLAIMAMCFDTPFKLLALCGVAAYCLQNIIYRIMSLFEIAGVVYRLFLRLNNWKLAYYLICSPVMLLVFAAAYFLVIRRMNAKGLENIYSRNVLLISTVSLVVTIILCTFTNQYWWQYELSIINYCFTVLSNVFILIILSGMFVNAGLRSEIEVIKGLWEQDKRHYELAKENVDIINIRCHDLKHRIQSLRLSESGISADELEDIEKATAIYDSTVKTGCDPIDVLITEKSLICLKRSIKLTCMADCEGLGYLSESELYSLFGNMLTNAINAVGGIADEERRVIDLTVKRVAGMTLINCKNYFDGAIILKNGLPQTTAEDKTVHGFGVKSMSLIVRKYGGDIYFSTEKGVFDLKIMLPEKTRSQKLAAA